MGQGSRGAPGANRARKEAAGRTTGANRTFCIKSRVECIRCTHVLSIFERVRDVGPVPRCLLAKNARSVAAGALRSAVHKPRSRPQGRVSMKPCAFPYVDGPRMPARGYADGPGRGLYRCSPIHFSKKWADGAAGPRPSRRTSAASRPCIHGFAYCGAPIHLSLRRLATWRPSGESAARSGWKGATSPNGWDRATRMRRWRQVQGNSKLCPGRPALVLALALVGAPTMSLLLACCLHLTPLRRAIMSVVRPANDTPRARPSKPGRR